MNNLSPRDMFLVIILVNIVCYWIGYQFIMTPLLNTINDVSAKSKAVSVELKDLETEAANQDIYINEIYELEATRRDEINSKFYQSVNSEKFHRWFNNLKSVQEMKSQGAAGIQGFTIERKIETGVDESGETFVVDFVDNVVTINFKATQDQFIKVLDEIENDGKSSALKNLSFSPIEGGLVEVKLTYSFYSINKEDGDDKDFSSSKLTFNKPEPNNNGLNLAKK